MATADQVLALLTGAKVFDGATWRVHDAGGVELADPGGVLWRGVHGALLWGAVWQPAAAFPATPVALGGGGGGGIWSQPVQRYSAHGTHDRQIEVPISAHAAEDEDEIVMAILLRIAHLEYYA